jgi:hypothetical protein
MQNTHETDVLVAENLDQLFSEIKAGLHNAVTQELPMHDVELMVWKQLLALGRQLLGHFLDQQGTGDLGETLKLPDGRVCRRLEEQHPRRYVSIFGELQISRTVYGSREGQKIDFVPLDNRLQLPEGPFSYVLQDWDQSFCVESPFATSARTIERILGIKQSVDSLERMNAHVAKGVEHFRENRPMPQPEQEGELLVVGADGKGIVMRRDAEDPTPRSHRGKGEKASRKRMAIVGVAYTVDRYVRSPEEIVAALFRDRQPEPKRERPQPQNKHVWAGLSRDDTSAIDVVYPWLLNEVVERNRKLDKEMVFLHDGQEALWEARDRHLPRTNATDIVDLLHVTPRLWQLAHLFHKEGSDGAEKFVRDRLLQVLRGDVDKVIRSVRALAGRRKLSANRKRTLTTICNYFQKNRERMRYADYLEKGYPIATGVIEGACRHFVKDRMERAGMHWTPAGAQAMLDVRSTWVNGDWEAYQAEYRRRETVRLYPHQSVLDGVSFAMAG